MELDWLDDLSRPSHGALALDDLAAHGLNRTDVARLVRDGMLVGMLPRVYRTASAPESFMQAVWAAHKWAGDDAVISHRTALRLRGWPSPHGRFVDLSVAKRIRPPADWPNVRFTRRDPFAGSELLGGLPTTGPGRTLLDASAAVTRIRLEMAVDHALRVGAVTIPQLWGTLLSAGGRGCAGVVRLREPVIARDDGRARSHSHLEILLDHLLANSDLPPYERQFEVITRSGIPASVDFAWPEAALGVETDGYAPHFGRRQQQSDMARQNALGEVGWLLLRFSWEDVTRRSDYVLDTIRRTLAMRLSFCSR